MLAVPTSRSLTRQESKRRTRERLLTRAIELLREREHSAIAIAEITAGAGITQPAFYRHFATKEECLAEAIRAEVERLRRALRESRRTLATADAGSGDAVREVVRFAVDVLVREGEVLKLLVREIRSPDAGLGLEARALRDELLADTVRDVAALGASLGAAYERRYLEMVIEGLVGLGEPLVLGHLEGRYRDVEAIVDLLVRYLRAALPELLERLAPALPPPPAPRRRGRRRGPTPGQAEARPPRRRL